MSIEQGLYAHLSSHAGLTALVGDRIYPLVLPQKVALPAVVYQRISLWQTYTHNGASLARPRFQNTCVGRTYAEAHDVAAQVRDALSGYRGMMGSVAVEAAFIDNEREDYEPETDSYIRQVDVIIWHR